MLASMLSGISKRLLRNDYTSPQPLLSTSEAGAAATAIDKDDTVSRMAVAKDNTGDVSMEMTGQNPDEEGLDQYHRELQQRLMEAEQRNLGHVDVNQQQKNQISQLQNQIRNSSGHHRTLEKKYSDLQRNFSNLNRDHTNLGRNYTILGRNYTILGRDHANLGKDYTHLERAHADLERVYSKLEQEHDDLTRKHKSTAKKYEDLDKKYMDIARTLQVTEDDPSTIHKKLEAVYSSIENMVIKGRGKASVNLNKDAAIQYFRDHGLLQVFPVQENQLEPFHLNLMVEWAMMYILNGTLFSRPLHCIFDRSHEFEVICDWMRVRGSSAVDRWRQELCILIAQGGEKTARKKETEVAKVRTDLEVLLSVVYGHAGTSMSSKVHDLCNMAFDLTFAMFGMESKVDPTWPAVGTPFNSEHMTIFKKSDPESPVSLAIFPMFMDNRHRLYVKAKVWCPRKENLDDDKRD